MWNFRFLSDLEHTSLILLKEVSEYVDAELAKCCQRVIDYHIECEEGRKDVHLGTKPASPERFGYAIRDLRKDDLLVLRNIFDAGYSKTCDNKYKRVVECIDIIFYYRGQLLESLFLQQERLNDRNLDFYVQLIPRDIVFKMTDYCEMENRILTSDYVEEIYDKIKKIGRM